MTKQNSRGFTIIEVVLVLAIAGLIFLIVFLALPQLQRSRRDTQRKSDVGRALAALESYAGNNSGTYPTYANWGTFASGYLTSGGASFGDPSTGSYTVTGAAGTAPTAAGQIQYAPGFNCAGGQTAVAGATRDIAVVIFQESGGTFCQDNQ